MADVVFLLDMSTNSSWEDFDYLKEFLEESISALTSKSTDEGWPRGPIATVTKVVSSTLSRGGNKSEVLQDIQSLAPLAGKAYTGAALRKIRKEVFSVRSTAVGRTRGCPRRCARDPQPIPGQRDQGCQNLRRQGGDCLHHWREGANNTQLEKIAASPLLSSTCPS